MEVKDCKRNWEITIVMIIVIGFAAMTFAMWRLYKHVEERYPLMMETLRGRVKKMDAGWTISETMPGELAVD